MDLRRNALKSVDLLEKYVKESLASGMRYVEDIAAKGPDTPVGQKEVQIPKMTLLNHQAVLALEGLINKTGRRLASPIGRLLLGVWS
jgi:hypothetical protein